MATVNATSTGSSIDVNSLVSQLMSVERQPLLKLQRKEASYQAKLSAYGSASAALSTFNDAVKKLDSLTQFNSIKSSTSNTDYASISTKPTASPGSYSLEISQLAQNHKLASATYADSTAIVGTGTLTINFGTYASVGNTFTTNTDKSALTITIDSTNNTLTGVRDAINAKNSTVRASIVNDGTGSRLVLTNADTGAANSMKVSVVDSGDANNTDNLGLSKLAYDPTLAVGSGKNLTQQLEAKDAKFTLDGISLTKSSNVVTDALEDVTLTLKKVTTEPQTVSITRDASSVQSNVQAFVKAYNDLNKTLKDLTAYDAASKQAGMLVGDSAIRSIQNQLRGLLTSDLGSSVGAYSSFSDVGIAFQKDGTLNLDTTKFSAALTSNPDDIAKLFTTFGNTTDSRISYVSSTSKTQGGTFAVNITTPATQGKLVGGAAAGLTITAATNDALSLTINGKVVSVTLGAGTYTADTLAAEIQTKINANSTLKGAGESIKVSNSSGVLTITSSTYGSLSKVSNVGGNAASGIFGASPTSTDGVDVVGTINGLSAKGSGQKLTTGDGLVIKADVTAAGSFGSINFSRGIAHNISETLTTMLDANKGTISSRTAGINESIKSVQKKQTEFNQHMVDLEKRYRRQYTALDSLLSSMQQTSNYLSQQLSSLQSSNS